MLRSLFIAAGLAAVPLAAAAQPADDPLAVVGEVMRLEVWSVAIAPNWDEDQPFSDTSLARFYTPEFAAAYKAVMEMQERIQEPLIDGDLILNSQEYCPPREVTLTQTGAGASQAVVEVSFRAQWCWEGFVGVPQDIIQRVDTAVFHLVRGADGWRIDDIDAGGSVRDFLAEMVRP